MLLDCFVVLIVSDWSVDQGLSSRLSRDEVSFKLLGLGDISVILGLLNLDYILIGLSLVDVKG